MLVSGKQQFLCWQLPNVMFLYIILHMAVNCQGTNVNVLLLATIYRQISYKCVFHISVCPRQERYGWYGHDHTNFCAFYWTLQSHFQGACDIHACSDLVELRALDSTGEHGLL